MSTTVASNLNLVVAIACTFAAGANVATGRWLLLVWTGTCAVLNYREAFAPSPHIGSQGVDR